MRVLVRGVGDIGSAVARRLFSEGYAVFTPDAAALVHADPWKSRLDLIERAVERQASAAVPPFYPIYRERIPVPAGLAPSRPTYTPDGRSVFFLPGPGPRPLWSTLKAFGRRDGQGASGIR